MLEILKILITIVGVATVSNGAETVNMIRFDGEARGDYFTGHTLPGGVDTQFYTPGTGTLSARYILEGVDCAGDSCRIFIENNGSWGEPYTTPRIVTDSPALSHLNGRELRGTIDSSEGQLTIHIYDPQAVPTLEPAQ